MCKEEHLDRARTLIITVVAILVIGVITLWIPKHSVYKAKRELAAALYEHKELFSEHQQRILRKASKSLLYAGNNIHVWEGDNYETHIGGGTIFWIVTTTVEESGITFPSDASWTSKRADAIDAVISYHDNILVWMLAMFGIPCRNLLVLFAIYQIYDWICSYMYMRHDADEAEEGTTA